MLPIAPFAEFEQTLHEELDVRSTSSLLLPSLRFSCSEKKTLFITLQIGQKDYLKINILY